MKITALKPQQKNKNRISVYIDGCFSFGIEREIALIHKLVEGMEVTPEFVEKVLKDGERKRAYDYALMLLTYRARSEKEIRQKMISKGYEPELVERTVCRLRELGLLDDKRYAEQFARDRITYKGYGNRRLRYELALRGVPRETMEEVLAGQPDEYQRALNLARKKLEHLRFLDERGIYNRLGGYLLRRGYACEVIRRVLGELLEQDGSS